MGCKQSTQQPGRRRGTNGGAEVAFGNGVHIGRAGNIDLCRRNLDFLGVDMVRVITTDELHRQATSLSLTDNKLYVLGREMLLLPELEELDVDGNRLQRIPEILTKLPKLWRINASMNPLDAGNGFAVLHQLKALRSLALRDCALKHLPRGILDCTTLEELDLSGNAEIRLQGKDLTGLPNLRKLSVAHCGLGGNQLPLCIRKLNSLVMLDISANDYHMDAANFFGPHLARSLTELHLRDLNLTAVPQVIITLKNLRELDLGGNPIETLDVLAGRIVKRIPRATTAAANNSNSNNNNIVPTSSAPPEYRADDPLQLSPLSFSGAGDVAGVVPPTTTTTTTDDAACADGEADVEEDNISINSFNSHASSRQSMSKVSKIGVISSVAQPLPVKKLSLRGCDLRTVPKYFHKMTSLEELDLSENENLDDANMTLFSLHNLRVLNIVGCPFADDTSRSRNEWFDIAKLRNLVEIHWELWKGAHNVSPYRTCIPIELCGLSLQRINEVALRPDLFVGETAETVIQLMRDGYYKINLGIDENLISSHVNALNAFLPAEKFFFPDDTPYATGAELSELNVNISISRYIFFLAMQAANYDAVIIPPIDVMIVHYAQLTLDPVKYRADCEAVCNRVLNCNYRTFFREQIRHVAAARDSIGASKKVWNMMVRSAQRDLEWLRYNFWDRRAHALCGSATEDATSASSPTTNRRGGGGPSTSSSVLQSLPHAPFTASEEVLKQSVQELRAHDSQQDLAAVLDQAITSHFMEQGNGAIRTSLQQFFRVGRALVNQCDASGDKISLDWSTYVKYMALFAYRIAQRKDGGAGSSSGGSPSALVEPAAASVSDDASPTYAAMMPMKRASKLGPRYDTLEEPEHNPIPPEAYLPLPDATASPPQRGLSSLAVPRRTISALSAAASSKDRNALDKRRAAIRQLSVNPIPTTGITLLLHAHRTSHLKYYQTLSLFGIEDTDIDWGSSPQALEQTKRAWGALYEEEYVGGFDLKCSGSGPRNGSTRSTRGGGAAASSSSASACRSLYDPFSSDARNTNFTYCADAPLPECGGTKHTQRDRNARHVTFTCGDSTAGFSEPSL